MSNSTITSDKVVIDAGVAVWALLPLLATADITGKLMAWREEAVDIYAPSLWLAETTSAIRRAVSTNIITPDEGRNALDDLIALDITISPITPAHCRAAFAWAELLGQSKAYDGFYLALANEQGATFYTTDQRLVRNAQQKGITWVKWIDEA